MRNYSDAAKLPAAYSNIRAVAHPENLYYPNSNLPTQPANVNLRVYAYYDGLDNWTTLDSGATKDTTTSPAQHPTLGYITILVDQAIAPGAVTATAIIGNSAVTYAAMTGLTPASAPVGATTVSSGMQFTVTNPTANTTEILLMNTPLRCVPTTGENLGALNPNDRLYGAEYIPCPVDTLGNFNTNLAQGVTTRGNPKNTARWILTLPLVPGEHKIETCLGQNVFHSGWPTVDPSENISRTYVWVGNGYPPPYTERFQYLGDPRDEPYLDCKLGTAAVFGVVPGNNCVIPPNSFNWWFKDVTATAGNMGINNDGYSGYSIPNLADMAGWEGKTSGGGAAPSGGQGSEVDMPRYYETIRNGLLNTTGLWGVINGWTCYYYGMGGEFGADQSPFNNGVSINNILYSTANTPAANVAASSAQEILGGGGFMGGWGGGAANTYMRVIASTNNNWYERSWLGEIYPDSMNATWAALGSVAGSGNLPVAGAAAGPANFYRAQYNTISTTEITSGLSSSKNGFGRDLTSAADSFGSPAFMNGVATAQLGGGPFTHSSVGPPDIVANIASLGQTCFSIFGYPLPALMNVARPWQMNTNALTSEWDTSNYQNERTSLNIPSNPGDGMSRMFYNMPGANEQGPFCSAAIQIVGNSPAGSNQYQYAYFLESGLDISANVGLNDLGETALVVLLRTFLDGGLYPNGQGHIFQIPLIETYCDNPAAQYSMLPSPPAPANIVNLLIDGPVTTGVPLTVTGFATFNSGPTTNVWYRWPGYTSTTGNYYTEEYPGYPNLSASTYNEPISQLDFNIKVSSNAGKTWSYIQDGVMNNAAVTGILDTNAAHLITVNSMPVTYAWDVTNATNFPQNDYWICAEAYRHGYPFDYSFHVLDISIIR